LEFDQTLVAISEVSKAINRESPDFFRINAMEYGRFLVLSLGTGTAKSEGKYDADEAAKWGILGWLTSDHSTPLVDVFTQASGDMVDFHISTVFQALNSEENYLRIQVLIYHANVVIQCMYLFMKQSGEM
jgi:uncharacterized protein (UPF0212 family)